MEYKTCKKCGRQYKRQYCEFCQREEKFDEANYYHFLTPRMKRDIQAFNIRTREEEIQQLSEGGGVFIVGPIGSGKTLYGARLMLDYIKRSYVEYGRPDGCEFYTVPILLNNIRQSYNDGSEKEALSPCFINGLLVLDDLGAEKLSEWVLEKLDLIINYRYEQLYPTIFTSNIGSNELIKRIGYRTPSRIEQMCKIVKMKDSDYRMKKK